MIAATAIVTVGALLGGMTTTVCAADIKGFSGEESAPYLESFKNTALKIQKPKTKLPMEASM